MEKNKELTPMQEFITALTENGLISINQTLIDRALKDEEQLIMCAWIDGKKNKPFRDNIFDDAQDYYNSKFKTD